MSDNSHPNHKLTWVMRSNENKTQTDRIFFSRRPFFKISTRYSWLLLSWFKIFFLQNICSLYIRKIVILFSDDSANMTHESCDHFKLTIPRKKRLNCKRKIVVRWKLSAFAFRRSVGSKSTLFCISSNLNRGVWSETEKPGKFSLFGSTNSP